MKYTVIENRPGCYFKIGDVLETSERIPLGTVGKFIDETTGWAWVTNPENYPGVLVSEEKQFQKERNEAFERRITNVVADSSLSKESKIERIAELRLIYSEFTLPKYVESALNYILNS